VSVVPIWGRNGLLQGNTTQGIGGQVMCGIVACRTDTSAVDYLYRGYDSVGVAVRTTTGGVARLRSIERIGALERQVCDWAGPHLGGTGIGRQLVTVE
jgi:hypothetical protein